MLSFALCVLSTEYWVLSTQYWVSNSVLSTEYWRVNQTMHIMLSSMQRPYLLRSYSTLGGGITLQARWVWLSLAEPSWVWLSLVGSDWVKRSRLQNVNQKLIADRWEKREEWREWRAPCPCHPGWKTTKKHENLRRTNKADKERWTRKWPNCLYFAQKYVQEVVFGIMKNHENDEKSRKIKNKTRRSGPIRKQQKNLPGAKTWPLP